MSLIIPAFIKVRFSTKECSIYQPANAKATHTIKHWPKCTKILREQVIMWPILLAQICMWRTHEKRKIFTFTFCHFIVLYIILSSILEVTTIMQPIKPNFTLKSLSYSHPTLIPENNQYIGRLKTSIPKRRTE